jgi:hypothetical protein
MNQCHPSIRAVLLPIHPLDILVGVKLREASAI